jgi:hypothetical protein
VGLGPNAAQLSAGGGEMRKNSRGEPRVLGNWKKIYRVDFFAKASCVGLTNYVIRHTS